MTERRTEIFETPNPVALRVGLPKGRVKIVAAETAETVIELVAIHGDELARTWIEQAEIERNGDEIVVCVNRLRTFPALLLDIGGRRGAIEVSVRVPQGSAAKLTSISGSIETSGRLGEVSASNASGAILLDVCAGVSAHTVSGDIAIASTSGSVDAETASGRVTVAGAAGEAKVKSVSGDIDLGRAGNAVKLSTLSGKIDIGRVDHGHIRAKTVSGKITVGVARGTAAYCDVSTVSGRVRSELNSAAAPADGDPQVELVLSTVSGSVNVARA